MIWVNYPPFRGKGLSFPRNRDDCDSHSLTHTQMCTKVSPVIISQGYCIKLCTSGRQASDCVCVWFSISPRRGWFDKITVGAGYKNIDAGRFETR